ncbi:MAG: ketopantoate reductase family protein, partial [Candidatus Binatia bacterium]
SKALLRRLVPATCDHQSSMLQDLERGKRTEIDALNGKIWSYARHSVSPRLSTRL